MPTRTGLQVSVKLRPSPLRLFHPLVFLPCTPLTLRWPPKRPHKILESLVSIGNHLYNVALGGEHLDLLKSAPHVRETLTGAVEVELIAQHDVRYYDLARECV